MSLLVKAAREGQTIARVTPESAGWKYVGFAAYRMEPNEVVHVLEASREVCIVVMAGAVDIET
ncbi:MAG TPA: 5-deoxy-glucuronate isomerase, partial [Paraburkholderia sp.]|nr:5-deoxy-glucuronate isomerase [Paraburkholderia sp.]